MDKMETMWKGKYGKGQKEEYLRILIFFFNNKSILDSPVEYEQEAPGK